MSTKETNSANVEIVEESLEDFASELFGGSKEASGDAKPKDSQDDNSNDDDAPEEQEVDTQSDDEEEDLDEVSEDDDTLAPETDEDDESDDSEDEDDDPQPKKKKKNRFQERIDELTAKAREAERQREADRLEYERKLAELNQKLEGNKDEKPKAKSNDDNVEGPNPSAKDENGNPLYPLGEYDPKYLKDMVQHMLDSKEQQQKQEQQLSEQERQKLQSQQALQTEWNTKLETARERYPDFQQKGEQMLSVFEGIDEQYGDYLTTTLMEMDNGPDVFYYLSSNIDEAQEIVAAGPKKATIALAKLEAKLADGGRKGRSQTKVSKAKAPPPANKGSSVASSKSVESILESDDLNSFEKVLFRPK